MTVIKLIEQPEFHYVDQGDAEPLYEPDITDIDVGCDFCKAGIGWTEYLDEGPHGEELEGYRWREYYEITRDGDTAPTKLCEDCMDWVGAVGADVAAYNAAWQAAHTWSADRARHLRDHPELANQPGISDTREGLEARLK